MQTLHCIFRGNVKDDKERVSEGYCDLTDVKRLSMAATCFTAWFSVPSDLSFLSFVSVT